MFEQQVKSIFERPGRSWNPREREIVIEWIHDPARHTKLLAVVLHQLKHRNISDTDIEEAWGDFAVKQIYSVLINYDPTKENSVDFWNYLKSCFRKFCPRSIGKFHKMRRIVTDSLDADEENRSSGAALETERTETRLFLLGRPTGRSPLKDMENGSRVEECIHRLPPHYSNVLVLYHVEGYTIAEIAQRLNKTEGYVKPTLARAREKFIELYEGRR
jgi:RNA polymerase sigma factor (sigma-70 family)